MEIFTSEAGWSLLARWTHFLAGITWIGLLYYFNFVQAPFVAASDASVKSAVTRGLAPRALAWFRYSALVTWLAGITMLLFFINGEGWERWDDVLTRGFPQGLPLLTGMVLGTIMLYNVWGVIWPKQQIIIASAEAVAGGGSPDPQADAAARRALLASRTNVLLSIPMLFFMATSAHLLLAPTALTGAQKTLYLVLAGLIILAVELNALVGTTGPLKKPLEKIGGVIVAGFALFAVLYTVLQVTTA